MKDDFYEVDKYRLDEEWEDQPRMFRRYAMALAEANADYERAKANEKVVYAEVEQAFRLARAKDDKAPTEPTVKSAVLTDSKYRDAVAATIEAGHAADIAKVAVDTIDQRKKALENLVSLFLASYYARPRTKTPEESSELDVMRKRKLRNKS